MYAFAWNTISESHPCHKIPLYILKLRKHYYKPYITKKYKSNKMFTQTSKIIICQCNICHNISFPCNIFLDYSQRIMWHEFTTQILCYINTSVLSCSCKTNHAHTIWLKKSLTPPPYSTKNFLPWAEKISEFMCNYVICVTQYQTACKKHAR